MADQTKNEDSGDAVQPQTEPSADTTEDTGDGLPANQVTIEDAGPAAKKITIEIDRKRIDAKFDEIFGELHQSAQVPGFRIGRAPRRLLEKRFGKEAAEDVRNGLVAEALGKIDEREDLNILGEPDIKLEDIELPETGNLSFQVEVEVKPEFDMPDYKGIDVTEPSAEPTAERVEQATRRFLAQRGTMVPSTEPIGADDLVVADVTFTGEGIDAKHPNSELRVGPAAIDGVPLETLGDELTGAKVGESISIDATVPEGHENEDWQSKKVTVAIDIKEVKKLELPELDDQLASEFGFDTAAQFTEFVTRNLEAQLKTESQQAMREQVCDYLLDAAKIELPEGLAKRHAARTLSRRYVDLLYRGVPREQIEQNMELLEAQAGEQSRKDLALGFVLEEVAKAESIEVAEGEVNARIAEMASRQGRRPERLRTEMANQGTLDQVEIQIREQRALDKVLELANVKPAPAEPAAKPAAKKAKAAEKTKEGEKAPKAAKKAAKAPKTPKKAKKSKKAAPKAASKDDKKSKS